MEVTFSRQAAKDLRRRRELSVDQAARRMGRSNGLLSKIEQGESLPSVPTLTAMARVYRCDVGDFFVSDDLAGVA